MSDDRFTEDIKAYADGELGSIRRWQVRRHLAGCESCRGELSALESVRNALAALAPTGDTEEALSPALTARLLAITPPSTDPVPHRAKFRGFAIAGIAVTALASVSVYLLRPKPTADAPAAPLESESLPAAADRAGATAPTVSIAEPKVSLESAAAKPAPDAPRKSRSFSRGPAAQSVDRSVSDRSAVTVTGASIGEVERRIESAVVRFDGRIVRRDPWVVEVRADAVLRLSGALARKTGSTAVTRSVQLQFAPETGRAKSRSSRVH